MFSKRIGIDLGSARVLVVEHGGDLVLDEPAVVAIDEDDGAMVALGDEARELAGRYPGEVQVVRPMREGAIPSPAVLEAMLTYVIAGVIGRFTIVRPDVVIGVPLGLSVAERAALREAVELAGGRRPAHLVPEPLAAAMGAEIPVESPRGHMVVDLGAGRTQAAVISVFGIVAEGSLDVAGDRMDDAIAQYIARRYHLSVSERTAERLKRAAAAALPAGEDHQVWVRGRDMASGLPRTVAVRASEVRYSIQDHLASIARLLRDVLERTPRHLAEDVADRGIVLTGGGALLPELDRLLTHQLGVPVHVADEPELCVARGAAAALAHLDMIERSLSDEEASLARDVAT